MIYSIDGSVLTAAYNKNGQSLSTAYNIDGQPIFSQEQKPDYSKHIISTMFDVTLGQGIDIHGNIMAVWTPAVGGILLRSMENGDQISSIPIALNEHGNDISFTDEYYGSNDEFPTLCIESKHFYRITRDSATKVLTLSLPSNGHNLGYGSAFDGSIMYAIGYAFEYQWQEGNYIRLVKFDLSDLTDNGDGTFTPAVLNIVDREWLPCIQGAAFHDGMVWIACGMSYPANVYALDPITGEIVVDIDLVRSGELEGLAWAYNNANGWYAVVGQRGYGYKKIVFE